MDSSSRRREITIFLVAVTIGLIGVIGIFVSFGSWYGGGTTGLFVFTDGSGSFGSEGWSGGFGLLAPAAFTEWCGESLTIEFCKQCIGTGGTPSEELAETCECEYTGEAYSPSEGFCINSRAEKVPEFSWLRTLFE